MFRFENNEYLYLLIAIIPLLLWMIYSEKSRQKQRNNLIEKQLFDKIVPAYNPKNHWLRNILIILTFIFSIFALANPQWANKREKVKVKSSDIFIALDISRSMMGQDISPNRLEKAKKTIGKLIDKLKGDRIGLIFFAGDAFMKMPLSTDYAAAKLFVISADPALIDNQGTAIEEAINIAENGFDHKETHQRAMIIFSDGEDHDGDAINRVKEAHKNGLVVFTIGVGTTKGAFIPYKNSYGVEQYMKDKNGNYIKSILNEELLNELADMGGGKYYSILDENEIIDNIAAQLEKIEKREIEQRSFKHYDSFFQYFLFFAIISLILTFIISNSKLKMNGLNKKIKNTLSVIAFLFLTFNLPAQSGHKLRLESDKLYTREKYEDAEIKYKKALEKEEEHKANYNLGNALFKQKRYEEAAESYEKALKETSDSLIRSKIYHNLGNSYFQQKKYDKSLEYYKQALRLNPYDSGTRKNLAIVKQIIRQQQQQQQQQNQKQQQKQQNQKQQQQKDKNNKDKQDNKNKQEQEKKENKQEQQQEQKQDKSDSLKNNQQQQQNLGQDSLKNIPDSLKMTKKEILKLLKAIENDDKEIQKKIRMHGKSKKRDKDW